MPTFCRHNRLIQNCAICSREQAVELRPLVSSSEPRTVQARPATPRSGPSRSGSARSSTGRGLTVRRLDRAADDGFRSQLVPGLRSSADAERLAEELAFATARLRRLGEQPPGLYAEVADRAGDLEERTWLAFLIAYLGPLDGDDPFATVRAIRVTWVSGQEPHLEAAETGPRGAPDLRRGSQTVGAYRAWAQRAGSQASAFVGEAAWSPQRRFARTFERLALPGLHRDARFDLLVTLGHLGVYELRAAALQLGADDEVTVAAKRALGIGDPILLERRAAELADACAVPLEALDLGLYNWGRGERATMGLEPDAEPDPDALGSALEALGL